ncbi:hypothetical protein CK216_29180 [Mesorhizobium sp. WSM3876]|nr:hypothetical protein CK216_29180 [Mesorhizobium sp. WSM3876]
MRSAEHERPSGIDRRTTRHGAYAVSEKIDGEALVRALLASKRGEPRVCAMVRAADFHVSR